LVDKSRLNAYAVIPGLFIGRDESQSHAFIQIMNGNERKTHYLRYPLRDFTSEDGHFYVRIGPNRFSSDRMSLDIRSDELVVRGELRFSGLTPWPQTLLSPGIMGWYAWIPFMECYRGIVSIDRSGVQWSVRRKEWTLEMNALGSEGGLLQAPDVAGMVNRIPESINSSVEIKLSAAGGSVTKTLFQGVGNRAGYESAGNLDRLAVMAGLFFRSS
jgi:hypothetical protein